jgi:hypothetical protein
MLKNDSIRNADHPEYKEKIMSQLFGEVIGFLKAQGLTPDKEYATQVAEVFQCSKKVVWVDELHSEKQLVICFDSLHMIAELGVAIKKTKEVLHRNKIENLRYQISPGTDIILTEGSQAKYNALFTDFKAQFESLKQK